MPNQYVGKTHCKQGHEFVESNIYWHGKYRRCRACRAQWGRQYNERVKVEPALRAEATRLKREWYERARAADPWKFRLSKYGLTAAEYDRKLVAQDGLCAVCRTGAASDIDHDHETAQVRDLLCHRCNVFVGALENNHALLNHALEYLARWKR